MTTSTVKGEGWSALVLSPSPPVEFFVVFAPCSIPGRKGWPPKERLGPFASHADAYDKVRAITFAGAGSAYVENRP